MRIAIDDDEFTGPAPVARDDDRFDPPRRKQVSLFLALPDYRKLRRIAARNRIPMGRQLVEWIQPHLDALPAC